MVRAFPDIPIDNSDGDQITLRLRKYKSFCFSRSPSQVVVDNDHNISEVTERLFVMVTRLYNNHNILYFQERDILVTLIIVPRC